MLTVDIRGDVASGKSVLTKVLKEHLEQLGYRVEIEHDTPLSGIGMPGRDFAYPFDNRSVKLTSRRLQPPATDD